MKQKAEERRQQLEESYNSLVQQAENLRKQLAQVENQMVLHAGAMQVIDDLLTSEKDVSEDHAEAV